VVGFPYGVLKSGWISLRGTKKAEMEKMEKPQVCGILRAYKTQGRPLEEINREISID